MVVMTNSTLTLRFSQVGLVNRFFINLQYDTHQAGVDCLPSLQAVHGSLCGYFRGQSQLELAPPYYSSPEIITVPAAVSLYQGANLI